MNNFQEKWEKYFKGSPLPFVFFYSNEEKYSEYLRPVKGWVCMIGQLSAVMRGKTLAFTGETIGCSGGVRYSGYPSQISQDFKYFLSCGIPGRVKGERYKKSPELVDEYVKDMPIPPAEGKYIVFKRLDSLEEGDEPQVVVFYGHADLISGLFTLANFRSLDPLAVITPFCSGCGSIISYPLLEREKDEQRAVLGMFDVSARPYVGENVLSFAVPMKKFAEMVEDMDESFLITDSWKKVSGRIEKGGE